MQSALLRILIVGLMLLVAAMLMLPRRAPPPPDNATELPVALSLPDIELTDQRGTRLRISDLAGGYSLMFFGFSHCPDICPLTLQTLARALERFEQGRLGMAPRVIFVSVDPQRDTLERLREYVGNFHPAIVGATASEAELAPLLGTLGISVMRQTLPGTTYTMTHNPQVFVLDPSAEVVAIMSNAENPDTLVDDFRRIRLRHARGVLGRERAQ